MVDLSKISHKGRSLLLAYDQGLEHGPSDFNEENSDPVHVLKIALYGEYTGVIVHKGIAEKYYAGSPFGKELARKVPLIVKLNGKTSLVSGQDPYSSLVCTVGEAISLGASAVGYTIYLGSQFESHMFSDFASIERDAHSQGVPVIAWMYPRGKSIEGKDKIDLACYAARVGLEIGADIVKIQFPGGVDPSSKEGLDAFKKVVQVAGETKVVVSGGDKIDEGKFLNLAETVIKAGAHGMAVGRNIWQAKDPMGLTKKLKEVIFA